MKATKQTIYTLTLTPTELDIILKALGCMAYRELPYGAAEHDAEELEAQLANLKAQP